MNFTSRENLSSDRAPCGVLTIDVEASIDSQLSAQSRRCPQMRSAWVLLRYGGIPLGRLLLNVTPDGDPLETVIDRWLCGEGIDPANGVGVPRLDTINDAHARTQADGPAITAVVCTSGRRPAALQRCLGSLLSQSYRRYSILVVDNNPDSKAVQSVIGAFSPDETIAYATQYRKGLSRARNRSIDLCDTPIIAWLDDDEEAHPTWLEKIAEAFLELPGISAVCGLMAPGELATSPQIWFEQWGGHSKGRGFTPVVFGRQEPQNPLYPLPAFGSGGNMAYRVEALREIGGFDPALGAGTRAMGAEDTRAFTETLLSGRSIAYYPAAITYHYHRSDMEGFAEQLRGYGTGLTAYYTSLLCAEPTRAIALLKLVPRAIRDLRSPESVRNNSLEADFPTSVMKYNLRGLAAGPLAYVRGRREAVRAGFW